MIERGIRLADGLASVLRIGTGNLRVPIETLSGGNRRKGPDRESASC